MDKGSMANMFPDVEEMCAHFWSTPTIAERRESESSVETTEMRVLHGCKIMVDVGVQVNTGDLIFQFPSTFPVPYSVHHSGSNRSPPETQSVPQSPFSLGPSRKSGASRVVSWGKSPTGAGYNATAGSEANPSYYIIDSLVSSLNNLTVESNKLHDENMTLHQENMVSVILWDF